MVSYHNSIMNTDNLVASNALYVTTECLLILEREGNQSTLGKTLETHERLTVETLSH